MDGITYQGKLYQFFNGTALTNDNSLVRCIGAVPVEPRVYHWTGYLRPDTISNLIQSKPYLDGIREKVLKAKSILEEHNPSLISNGKAQRFQKVYEDLKSSKHETIEEYFQMARDKYEKNSYEKSRG